MRGRKARRRTDKPLEFDERELDVSEYTVKTVGVVDQWEFHPKRTRSTSSKTSWLLSWNPITWLLAQPVAWWKEGVTTLARIKLLLRFVFVVTKLTQGRFWIVTALRFIISFERTAVKTHLTNEIIEIASSASTSTRLDVSRLSRSLGGHVVLNWAAKRVAQLADELEEVVRSRSTLETRRQLLRMYCTLSDAQLQNPEIRRKVDASRILISNFTPFHYLDVFTRWTSIASQSALLYSRIDRVNAPFLAFNGALTLVDTFGFGEAFATETQATDVSSKAYSRLMTIFSIGTSPRFRRDVVSLNLQDYLLEEFEKSRKELGDTLLNDPNEGRARGRRAQRFADEEGWWREMVLNSSHLFNYILFAVRASTAPVLISLSELMNLTSQFSSIIHDVHYSAIHLQQRRDELSSIQDYYDSLELCREAVERQVEKREAMKVELEEARRSGVVGVQEGGQEPLRIEFKNVSMTYGTSKEFALQDVSFTVEPGEVVSIVGHNGSGKTTLFSLLSKSNSVTSGEILLNGIKLEDFPEADLRQRANFAFQSSPSLPLTIKEFVALGSINDRHDDELIKNALRSSGAYEVATSLPEGWHSYPSSYEGSTMMAAQPEMDVAMYQRMGGGNRPEVVPTRPAKPKLKRWREAVREVVENKEKRIGKAVRDEVSSGEAKENGRVMIEGEKEGKGKEEEKVEGEAEPKEPEDLLEPKWTDAQYAISSVFLPQRGTSLNDTIMYPTHTPHERVLSGGQWQRIALARNLMKPRTELLCFDEPAAALDPAAEAALFETIFSLRGTSTILFSTHRFSVTARADKILVFSHGKLIEQGTHASLMDVEEGEYRKMWEVQAAGFTAPSAGAGAMRGGLGGEMQ
ncbi:P-loop containing nucleoside triphosphate hydrolase protein [Pseudohyphozyma bogoriensis]|nr:P-loop containing nucleoside triphosphate hydrolase protein [Pseudohyphozyma bogoriensis]